MGKTSGSAGIQFEDVEGVGDEARFALTVGAGDLHVRVGNLYFTTAAYSGATMPMPERLTGSSMLAANKKWRHDRSEEHTSELQSLMRISYAVFCLKKKKQQEKKQEHQSQDTHI